MSFAVRVNRMNYLTSLFGAVASYGLRADQAARAMMERTIDEFSLEVCQKTGISFDFLTRLKDPVLQRVLEGRLTEPGTCKGHTKFGAQCKKRTLMEYCHEHRHQEETLASKKRRVSAHLAARKRPRSPQQPHPGLVVPRRFRFPY